jgi:plasmid maintenance system antidote protein VapI
MPTANITMICAYYIRAKFAAEYLTATDLANVLQVSRGTARRILDGERDLNMSELWDISALCGLKPWELVEHATAFAELEGRDHA